MKNVNFVENLLNKQCKLQSFNNCFFILNTQNGILIFFNLKDINLEMCLYNVDNIIFHISQIKQKFILERSIFVTYVNSTSVYLCLCYMFVICWRVLTYFIIVSKSLSSINIFPSIIVLVSFCHHLASVVCCPLTFHISWAMQALVLICFVVRRN